MRTTLKSKFMPEGEYELILRGRYSDGSPCIGIIDPETGEPQCVVTVCLENDSPDPGNIFVKNWSENEGILDALVNAGVIDQPIREVPTGFVHAYECQLTDKFKKELNI